MRPLLQVRSKGRPNLLFPEGNKDYRIAVFAQEVEANTDTRKKCKDTPVVILKTSEKHVINLNSGQIVGPYVANKEASLQKQVGPEDFVNTTSCCPNGTRMRKGCACNEGRVSKKKILRSFLDKRLAAKEAQGALKAKTQIGPVGNDACASPSFSSSTQLAQLQSIPTVPAKGGCCGSKADSPNANISPFSQPAVDPVDCPFPANFAQSLDIQTLDCGILKQEPQPTDLDSNPGTASQEFHAIAVPSCSIPGTCSCSSDCTCPSCEVHQGPKKEHPYTLDMLNNDSQYGSNLVLTSSIPPKNIDVTAGDVDSYTSYLSRIIGCNIGEPSQGEVGESSDSPEPASSQIKCSCAANSCFCSNCETHSIINGYRLDDIFGL